MDMNICYKSFEVLIEEKKTVNELAREVIAGKWGNGAERKRRLEAAGYGYRKVQDEVNALLRWENRIM